MQFCCRLAKCLAFRLFEYYYTCTFYLKEFMLSHDESIFQNDFRMNQIISNR